jgi:hypothetical protein
MLDRSSVNATLGISLMPTKENVTVSLHGFLLIGKIKWQHDDLLLLVLFNII